MKIIVGCEYSGRVREAFRKKGHDAWSCDLLESEDNSPFHIQDDILDVLKSGKWDMGIFHPPCTHLAVSGSRHFAAKIADGRQEEALSFVRKLMACNIPKWAIENPISIISSRIAKPTQVIQPWMFGHDETKATCLWLHNLRPLIPTHCKGGDLFTDAAPEKLEQRVWKMPPGPNRWKERSRTFQGIADQMAAQWG